MDGQAAMEQIGFPIQAMGAVFVYALGAWLTHDSWHKADNLRYAQGKGESITSSVIQFSPYAAVDTVILLV